MSRERILFVDDEPRIAETMPQVLRQQGYQVTAVTSVQEALAQIASTQFDVLISDLNISEQDDGLNVVGAMRRTQPGCLIFILTGFPGFDTALEAMRIQVDEYLIKPAPLPTLLDLLAQKLSDRRSGPPAGERLYDVLRHHQFEILQRAVRAMHSDIRLDSLPLDDEQRMEYIPQMIEYLAAMLEVDDPHQIEQVMLRQAELQGMRRYHQGYSIPLVAAHARHVERAILDVIHDHQSALDANHLFFDLKRLGANLNLQLEHALQAYLEAEQNGGRLMAKRPTA